MEEIYWLAALNLHFDAPGTFSFATTNDTTQFLLSLV